MYGYTHETITTIKIMNTSATPSFPMPLCNLSILPFPIPHSQMINDLICHYPTLSFLEFYIIGITQYALFLSHLDSFIQHNYFEIHSCWQVYQYFIPFYY